MTTHCAGRVWAAAILLAAAGAGCKPSGPDAGSKPGPKVEAPGSPASRSVQIKGSDTMLQLATAWAEAFQKAHPEIPVTVTGGGSGVGLTALIGGQCDVADASRPIDPKEVAMARSHGINPVEHEVARDALTIIVNPKNPVKDLTMDQIAGLYLGRTANWKSIGGADAPVEAAARDTSSGTYAYFKEHVLKKQEYGPKTLHLPSNNAIAQQVATDVGSIGYVGMGYVSSSVKAVSIKKDSASPAVRPTLANVLNNSYPLSRPLFEYTNGPPRGSVKTWIDFVTGPDGQKIVSRKEFIPVGK